MMDSVQFIKIGYGIQVRNIYPKEDSKSRWKTWQHGKIYQKEMIDNAVESLNRDYNKILQNPAMKFEFRKFEIYTIDVYLYE